MTPEQREQIRQIIREEDQKNYLSGTPRIPPHSHDGIDNVPISANNIRGDLVTSITAGSNISISPTSGVGDVTISSTASGGGGTSSPGGNNKNVQFNNSGVFGGVDAFQFNGTSVLTLDDGSQTGSGGFSITGGTSGLQIQTASGSQPYTGGIDIQAGDNLAAGGYGGNFSFKAGDTDDPASAGAGYVHVYSGNSNGSNATGSAGNFVLKGGNCGQSYFTVVGFTSFTDYNGYSNAGNVSIYGGNVGFLKTTNNGGNITLLSGRGYIPGKIHLTTQGGEIRVDNLPHFSTIHGTPNFGIGSKGFGGGQGVISIQNASVIPSTPISGGGLLFSNAGALYWYGGSGTLTSIGPA